MIGLSSSNSFFDSSSSSSIKSLSFSIELCLPSLLYVFLFALDWPLFKLDASLLALLELSLPLFLLSLAIVKLKGLSLFQLVALFRLIQTLRSSGRFSFNKNQNIKNSSTLSLEEAYRILNLDIKKKTSKKEVHEAYKKIQKRIHPDISPETSRLSTIVNEAKEIVLKNIF